MNTLRLLTEPFDPGAELCRFQKAQQGAGAVVTFSGIVRDDTGTLEALDIECFEAMAQQTLTTLAAKATERFVLTGTLILHRHGRLYPGETIMMVATASAHRAAAFEGAEFLMDTLKSRAPFWKKEIAKGTSRWVAPKETDIKALTRW